MPWDIRKPPGSQANIPVMSPSGGTAENVAEKIYVKPCEEEKKRGFPERKITSGWKNFRIVQLWSLNPDYRANSRDFRGNLPQEGSSRRGKWKIWLLRGKRLTPPPVHPVASPFFNPKISRVIDNMRRTLILERTCPLHILVAAASEFSLR